MDESLVSVDQAVSELRPLSAAKATSWPRLLYQWMGDEASDRPLVDRRHGEGKIPTSVPRITRLSLDAFIASWQPRGAGRKGAKKPIAVTSTDTETVGFGSDYVRTDPTDHALDGSTDIHELVVRLADSDSRLADSDADHERAREELLDRLKQSEIASINLKYENEKLQARLRSRNDRVELLEDRRELLQKVIRERLGPQSADDLPLS